MVYSEITELHILGDIITEIEKTGELPDGLKKNDIKKLYNIFFTLFHYSKIYIKEKRLANYLKTVCKIHVEMFGPKCYKVFIVK